MDNTYIDLLDFSIYDNYFRDGSQGSFVEAEAESSRTRRGRLNSRQGRGEATSLKKTLLPLDV